LRFLSIFLVLVFFSPSLFAQKKEFSSNKNDKWEEAKHGKSLVARYRLSSTKFVQVDVRSAPVPESSSQQYFTTFHNSLIKSGMKKGDSSSSDAFKGKKTKRTTYEMKRKKELYNVLVYELYRNGKAWLILAVTPAKKRGSLDQALPELLKGFSFP